jgi:hypothetical protein
VHGAARSRGAGGGHSERRWASRSRPRIAVVLASAGFLWGALTVISGMTREPVLTGTLHWMAQAAPLAVGAGAVIAFLMLGRPQAAAMV